MIAATASSLPHLLPCFINMMLLLLLLRTIRPSSLILSSPTLTHILPIHSPRHSPTRKPQSLASFDAFLLQIPPPS